MTIIFQNGQYLEAKEAKISPFDRSYLFGEGLFETFRSYDGQLLFLEDHLARLEWSSTFLGIAYPEDVNIKDVCSTLLIENHLKEARFKIVLSQSPRDDQVFTGSPVEALPENYQTNVVIFCERLLEDSLSEPCKLKTITNYTNDALPLAATKTTNYLVKLRARQVAKESGFYDGVLTNAQGFVTETCTGNIFWLDKDSNLKTIMEELGLLSGIMKKKIMDLLKENDFKVKQDRITAKELSHVKEIFVTNSVIGIKPVAAIDDRQISGGEAGDVTLMIMDLWKKKIDKSIGR